MPVRIVRRTLAAVLTVERNGLLAGGTTYTYRTFGGTVPTCTR